MREARRMRPSRTRTSDPEAIRNVQIAHLAEAALYPIVAEAEQAVLNQLVAIGRTPGDVSSHRVWVLIGELSAYATLRQQIRSAKAGITQLERTE